MKELDVLKGPLGLWNFPFINFILGLAKSGRGRQIPSKSKTTGLNLSAENVERWQLIRDPVSGVLQGLEVHREVKQVG